MKVKSLFATFFLLLICLLVTQTACKSKSLAGKNVKETIAWNTPEELVASMTLAEKIGQMTQAERGDLQKGDITKYALGSVLSGGGSTPATNTPDGWVKMVNGFIEESLQTRLGIPIVYGLDAVHGHAIVKDATVFPHNVGLGAIAAGDIDAGAWSAYQAGRITAQEMQATGVRWNFAPVLGVAEDVRWGRTYESYSEDVSIVSALGSEFIHGMRDGGAAACMKHFIGEGQAIDGRNQGNALLDRAGIERILPPYRAAIAAGALSLMPSFSSVNGIKMHQHKELLTDLLKDQMGFTGFVISDWAAIEQLTGGTYKAQIANAINAGVDMVMATNGRNNWVSFIKNMEELVKEGKVSVDRVDDAVIRIIRFKQSIGLFDYPLINKAARTVGSDENRTAARGMVADSLVLLKNKNDAIAQLPKAKNILVTGQGADDIGMQCGGWTISWQGGHGPITKGTTILEGIQQATKGKANITYSADGKASGTFDAVIAVVGENPYAESEGDRTDQINLRKSDMDMLQKSYGYGCPVVVIMLSGRPMTIGNEHEKWDAFIAAWLPGTEGGGIADVLFEKRDFTGRTPYTWCESIKGKVLFPFGYGLTK